MSDLAAENSRVSLLESIAGELNALNYVNTDAVNNHLQGVKDTFTNLQAKCEDRKTRIQDAIAAQQSLDSRRLDYAKKAAVRIAQDISFFFNVCSKFSMRLLNLYVPYFP